MARKQQCLKLHVMCGDGQGSCLMCDRPALSPPAEGEDRCASHKEHGIFNDPCCPHCEAPTPARVDWERVGPKLVEAAQRYFDGYCQDEAAEDALQWVGCSQEQHEAAIALKEALAAAQPEGK